MKPTKLATGCLACAILTGQMLGHGDGQVPHLPHDPSPIVQVGGPGKYQNVAEASNTRRVSDSSDLTW